MQCSWPSRLSSPGRAGTKSWLNYHNAPLVENERVTGWCGQYPARFAKHFGVKGLTAYWRSARRSPHPAMAVPRAGCIPRHVQRNIARRTPPARPACRRVTPRIRFGHDHDYSRRKRRAHLAGSAAQWAAPPPGCEARSGADWRSHRIETVRQDRAGWLAAGVL